VVYRAKKDMDTYPVAGLVPKDLVLVEASIGQYRLQTEAASSGSKMKGKYQGWDTWRAHLELCSVSILSKAPTELEGGEDADTADVVI
jgi:putative alpha-1,2-mannosidase